MTLDMCYLIPLNAIQKIPRCRRPRANSSRRSVPRAKRFLTDIISIGIGSAALTLSTVNLIQNINLQHQVTSLTNSLPKITDTVNSHTTQLFHLTDGQLKLAHELNHTQVALNRTIDLINDHSTALDRTQGQIRKLAEFAQWIDQKLTAFIHSVETHFIHTSLSDILANKLNLHFIHHKDLPTVLDFIVNATNVSFNPNSTVLPLVDLVSRLLVQQRIDFVPNPVSPRSPDQFIGTLSISSFFAAVTPDQVPFYLYELLPIPFPYGSLRVRLADLPFIIGVDNIHGQLIRWTQSESTMCDFRAMSVCRETPPIITDWNNTCLFQILTDTSLSECRTEQYVDPIFIHQLGLHYAISTNSTNHCHSTPFSSPGQSYAVGNNIRILPPVALITIPPNTTLVCDRFSISSSPIVTGPSLNILDSTILNSSSTDVFDLHLPLSNSSRWAKLPYIPAHFQAVLDFLSNTSTSAPLPSVPEWYYHPFPYLTLILMLIIVVLIGILIYCRFVRSPKLPQVHIELPTISATI